jgi:putative transposase
MRQDGDVRTGRHCVPALPAHLVFVTKCRHLVFTAIDLDRREAMMGAVGEDFGCELVEFNGETEHVHLLVNVPPTVARSRLVNSLKGVSSRRLRQEFPTWPGTTGGPGGGGRGRPSQAWSEVLG